MQDVDRWLGVLLSEFVDDKIWLSGFQHALREKLLESYRNGQVAGLNRRSKAAPTNPAAGMGADLTSRHCEVSRRNSEPLHCGLQLRELDEPA